MQLDIFENSRDVMLRNDVVASLERWDASQARAAAELLAKEFPSDDALPALRILANAIAARDGCAFHDHDALRDARLAMEDCVRPAARRTFGDQHSVVWLASLWQDLAQRAAAIPFHSERFEDHAAPLWLKAQAWREAIIAAQTIASWRRIPVPLAWVVHARLHQFGLAPTWAMVAELAWMSPRLFEDVQRKVGDPVLQQLKTKFETSFEGVGDADDLGWLPAWVLTERPALAQYLSAAQASQHSAPEQAMRLMVELLGLERQGRHHDIVVRRKTLRDLQPSLYAAYIKTR